MEREQGDGFVVDPQSEQEILRPQSAAGQQRSASRGSIRCVRSESTVMMTSNSTMTNCSVDAGPR
jgi:hypothetical protein